MHRKVVVRPRRAIPEIGLGDPARPQRTRQIPRCRGLSPCKWGAQTFTNGDDQNQYHFALASSLNNVCRLLNVELLQAHNVGAGITWGSTGHYTIGAYACDLLEDPRLKGLMIANKERISFDNSGGGLNPKERSQTAA